MYAGHAAIALALRRREPRLPIALLVIAAFGPDWAELLLMALPGEHPGTALLTHSIPAVLIGAGLAAALTAAMRKPGARIVFLAWLTHWPADLITGRKPLLSADHLVGFHLYGAPVADFALESVVVVIGCALYARAFPSRGDLRRVIVILGAALIALQAAVDVALSVMRNSEWTPSFAVVERRSHPRRPPSHGPSVAACLHFAPRTHDTRERWRWTVHEAS